MHIVGFEPTKPKHGILRPAPLTTREYVLKVVPGIEPGLPDSKSGILTTGSYDQIPTTGLEPAISGLEDRRLIH